MNEPIRTVVFDFEGTLVDFQWQLEPAEAELRRAYAALGYTVSGNYAQMWNLAAATATTPAALDALQRALLPVYDRWDADALTRWALRPGAVELLDELAARGVGAALVSNCGRAAIDAALARLGLHARLRPVISRNDVARFKPDPQGVHAALAATATPIDAALFVGDSLADVHAARAAGVRVAIISGGEVGAAALATAPPDWQIEQLRDVIRLVERVRA